MPSLDIVALRRAFLENRYFIKLHAKQRMSERKVSDRDLGHVILAGEAIEVTANAYPFPKALFMAEVAGEPLYVACAFDGQFAHIITVHWYDPQKWVDPRTRRAR